jgi:hypothetical protein
MYISPSVFEREKEQNMPKNNVVEKRIASRKNTFLKGVLNSSFLTSGIFLK